MTEEIPFEYQAFALSFREPGAISYFREKLEPEDVGLIHGNVGINQFYITLLSFYDKTGLDPIEPVSFKSWLETETEIFTMLGGKEGVDYFFDNLNGIKELSTPEAVGKLLRHRANKKRQSNLLEELKTIVEKKDATETERNQANLLMAQIRAIDESENNDPLSSVVTAIEIGETAEELWELPDFLETPFPSLNKALGYTEKGGVPKGALAAVLAQSGGGKSTFAKCLTNYWVESGYSVIYVNYEEIRSHWNRILMTQMTGQNIYLGEEVAEADKLRITNQFKAKMNEWGDRLKVLHDPPTCFYEDLEDWLRKVGESKEGPPDAIVIDTIQSMFLRAAGGRPRWGQFEEMMVRLEKLGKDLGSAIILTVQENTNRMKEKRDVVIQSDTGGSIAIVQKCSITMHIVDKGVDDDGEEGLTEIQIPKNRITGKSFSHNPPMVMFDDSTKSFLPFEMVDDERYDNSVVNAQDLFGEEGY